MTEAATELRVVLPWPSPELSRNARIHHMALARATKAYRRSCWACSLQAGAKEFGRSVHVGPLAVHLVFHPPKRHRYDADNLVARMKSGLDGLADALEIDDRHFRITQEIAGTVGGMVVVTVRELQPQGEPACPGP